jgi:hypothetical protein
VSAATAGDGCFAREAASGTAGRGSAAREMIASYDDDGREPPIGWGHVEQPTGTDERHGAIAIKVS